jgi:hypothetical protein
LKGEGIESSVLSVNFELINETLEANESQHKRDRADIHEALTDIYESFQDTKSQIDIKAYKTYVDEQDAKKADKTYVDE